MVWHATKTKLLLTCHPTETKLSLTWHPIIAKSIIQVVTILHTKRVMEQGWGKSWLLVQGPGTHTCNRKKNTLLGGMTLSTQCYIMVSTETESKACFKRSSSSLFELVRPHVTDFKNMGIKIYAYSIHLNILLSTYFWWAVTKIKVWFHFWYLEGGSKKSCYLLVQEPRYHR